MGARGRLPTARVADALSTPEQEVTRHIAATRVDEPTVRVDVRPAMEWGSDVVAELLRRLGLRYISLNPGSSYRGLHDSLVNYLGNESPEIVLCLHEEHAVAVAHGYAKVAGRPMAVALHSNVGLMHATMALFNAFCDRVPMVVLGATGPVEAPLRRPWIDWIHTAADQGALIRNYVKWDDQPASTAAAVEALVRADMVTRTYPHAPVYVCLDAAEQEAAAPPGLTLPDLTRHRPPAPPSPSAQAADEVAELLHSSRRPLLLAGRVGRSADAWRARVHLAERLHAAVLTDLRVAASFPTEHPLHPVAPATFLTPAGAELIREADVVLSLDWVDLGGTLRQAYGDAPAMARVISCTSDHVLHNGWSKDHFELPPVDLAISAHPDLLVESLLERLDDEASQRRDSWPPAALETRSDSGAGADGLRLAEVAQGLRESLNGHRVSLVRVPLSWAGSDWTFSGPLDYLGADGGAGLGSGPGIAVGAALALKPSGRLPVAVLGDGDLLMGATALWTAAHYRLPLLVVVANNRSYLNDEVHQERVARARDRPVANRWVGQEIRDPDADLASLAGALGLRAHGPVSDGAELPQVLARAASEAVAGETVLVDVRIEP